MRFCVYVGCVHGDGCVAGVFCVPMCGCMNGSVSSCVDPCVCVIVCVREDVPVDCVSRVWLCV